MASVCCCCGGHAQRRTLQRQTTVAQEESFKMEMEQLFDNHGNAGVRLSELETELAETELVNVIPRTKLQKLLKKADSDRNSYITYAEFMNMICAFIYFAVVINNDGGSVTAFTGIPSHNALMYKPHRRYEAWRYMSYMFVHQGYVHLITNLLFQLLLGLPLEIVHKWWRLMIVYVCGVIGGSLAHSVTDYNVNLVGASGGCYALIGAHLASVVVNWKEMNYKCSECNNPIRVMASAPFRLAVLFLLVFMDSANAVYRRFYDPAAGKVGISAHVGGILTGLMLGIPVMKNINILAWEKNVGWVALSVYIAAVIVCVLFNCLYKQYPDTDWTPCC